MTTMSSSSVSPPASLQAADFQSCDDVAKDTRDAEEPGGLANCELPASEFVGVGGSEATFKPERAGSSSEDVFSSVIVGFRA